MKAVQDLSVRDGITGIDRKGVGNGGGNVQSDAALTNAVFLVFVTKQITPTGAGNVAVNAKLADASPVTVVAYRSSNRRCGRRLIVDKGIGRCVDVRMHRGLAASCCSVHYGDIFVNDFMPTPQSRPCRTGCHSQLAPQRQTIFVRSNGLHMWS